MRYGRYVLITREDRAGGGLVRHFGGMGVFVARILPVIRH
jgi:hypothetical protein